MADNDKPVADKERPDSTIAEEPSQEEQKSASPEARPAEAAAEAPAEASGSDMQPEAGNQEGQDASSAEPVGESPREPEAAGDGAATADASEQKAQAETLPEQQEEKAEKKATKRPEKKPKAPASAPSPFGALAKFKSKLPPGPKDAPQPTRKSRRDEDAIQVEWARRPASDKRREPRRDGPPRGREGARRRDAGPGRGRDARPGRGRERAPQRREGPRIENVVSAAEKTTHKEALFAQTLFQALVSEVDRFSTAIKQIEGLDPNLAETVEAEARHLLSYAQAPLTRNLDGTTPLTIGVGGAPGVGKTTLIEALAADSKAGVDHDESGRASAIWRGIRFTELPSETEVDGVVEVRMPGIDPVAVGRPLLVVENERVNLHDGFVFEQFVENPDRFFAPPAAAPTRPHRGEEERPPRVHILAFALATRPEFKNKAQRLRSISRFDLVESQLALRLQYRGPMLRVQGFLDGLIEAILPLRDFALTVHLQSHQEARVWQNRLAEVKEEMGKWSHATRKSIRKNADAPFQALRGQLDAFVNKHAGETNVDEHWNRRLEGLVFEDHLTAELERMEKEYREKSASLSERLRHKRQPGEGPLPQPVILGALPDEFKDATARFHEALRAVGDPLHWITPVEPVSLEFDPAEPLPQLKDQLQTELQRRLDSMQKKLADELEGRFMTHIVLPVEKRLADSRSLVEALVHLGREGQDTLNVVNEVLLSLTQRLIERAAEHNRIRLPLIQKLVREPGHRTKLLVPPSRDLFPLARRLQDALGERVDLVPSVESAEARIASSLLPAKIKADMVTINEDKRMAQVRVPRKESGKAFGRNASNQRLAAALSGYHLHLRISKEVAVAPKEEEAKGATRKRKRGQKKGEHTAATDVATTTEQVLVSTPEGKEGPQTEEAKEAETQTTATPPTAVTTPSETQPPEEQPETVKPATETREPAEASGQTPATEKAASTGEPATESGETAAPEKEKETEEKAGGEQEK